MEYLQLTKDESWGWLFRGLFRIYLKLFGQFASDFSFDFIEMCDRHTFGGRRFLEIPKDEMRNIYDEWHKGIIATVPNENLLMFNVRQGWKPLCKFLDLPLPETDFPHSTMWSVKSLNGYRRASRAAILGVSIMTSYMFLMLLEWAFEISKYLGLQNKRNIFMHGTRKKYF